MNDYEISVGLEVHAELNTESKIFCGCRNEFGCEPNTNVCPICMGFPGALPTLNQKVVDKAVKMGQALNCKINRICSQDRKNYFYPDLPKAYQISQAEFPVCHDGYIDFLVDDKEKRVRINRIHIEEDAGKLLHNSDSGNTLIDYNRCGVPLIEIVTEPDMHSSSEAKAFLETIKKTLLYLGISDCKMQEGSIRCDVNVSVSKKESNKLGIRCEMKNVNSFSGAVRGIEYEARRQIEILELGGKIEQETRRWDDVKGISIVMRTKENAQDYRYFPEPDLMSIIIEEEKIEKIKKELPELPHEKIKRYVNELGIAYNDAVFITDSIERADFFDKCVNMNKCQPKNICKWIVGDITKTENDTGKSINETPLTAGKLVELISKVEQKIISVSAAQIIFSIIVENGGEVDDIINSRGLIQNSDEDYLNELVKKVLSENEKSVSDYKRGKTNAFGYIVGRCMKESGGKANPLKVKEIVLKYLSE